MAAGMHDGHFKAINTDLSYGRAVGEARAFLHGQSVHVRTDKHDGTIAIFQHADNAGSANLFSHDHARHGAQFLCHPGGSLIFAERQFRIAVEMIPQAGERLVIVCFDGIRIIRAGRRWCGH